MCEYDSSAYTSIPLVERLRGLGLASADEAAGVIEKGMASLWAMDPELWAQAEAEMEPYHSQVQGFVYGDPETDGNVHVVRDLTLPPSLQRVWSMAEDLDICQVSPTAAEVEYDRCHRAMMCAIRVRQIAMTKTHYLWGVTSGTLKKEER